MNTLLTDSLSETTTPMVVVDALNKAPFSFKIQPHLCCCQWKYESHDIVEHLSLITSVWTDHKNRRAVYYTRSLCIYLRLKK